MALKVAPLIIFKHQISRYLCVLPSGTAAFVITHCIWVLLVASLRLSLWTKGWKQKLRHGWAASPLFLNFGIHCFSLALQHHSIVAEAVTKKLVQNGLEYIASVL